MRKQKVPVEPELQVQSITDAEESSHVDLKQRMVRYGIQMGIRLLCFILAFFTTGIVQILCFAAAIFLPYIAVVLANVGNTAEHQPGSYARIPTNRALPQPAPTHPTQLALPAESSVLASSSFRHQRRQQESTPASHASNDSTGPDPRPAEGTTYSPNTRSWVVPPRDVPSSGGPSDH
ncbi:DUF3099 domain-containing protein [Micrococcoides hystricis]|uniref:DUF3099 domain-containing protein n=1 Tax=Micrococcoides hystricis TaxID=1572761 RepID=A0ABV6P7C7_9MICC